jgi:hypothetical protein
MKQTRQPVHTIKESIYLDVYGLNPNLKQKIFKELAESALVLLSAGVSL